jgi:hypothetical protein
VAHRGEQHHGAKLTAVEVRDIRRRHPGESMRALARAYGVSPRCIEKIVHGLTWKHVR